MKLKIAMGVVAMGVWLWSGMMSAHGQKATEMFIPVGQSPGLSQKISIIGTIETADAQNRTVAIASTSETWTATVTDRTKIWLDRSKLRLTNRQGTFEDLRKGLVAEVKYEGAERKDRGPAEWIKVQLTEPSATP